MRERFTAESPDESFCPAKVFQLRRQLFDWLCRHAGKKAIRFLPLFVQERLRAQHGMMRQNASTEEDRIRAGKGILADFDGLGGLPASGKIDAVSEQLRAKPADGGE